MSAILGIGGVTLDRVGVVPRMPGWDEVEYISQLDTRQGGMVATAMMTAASLGADAEYVGGIGDDAEGEFILTALRRGRVRADHIRTFHGGRTPVSFVLVHEGTGERTIIHHRGVQEESSLQNVDIDLSVVAYLHLDGYWFDTALEAARKARAAGIIVTIDPSSSISREKGEALFPLADYIIPSMKYAGRLTGESDPGKAARALLRYGARGVIITLGKDGCVGVSPGSEEYIPAFDVDVVDTTGAGDAFHGGFIYALSTGKDLREAVRFSSAVAALKCARPGGREGLPTLEEVQCFLGSHGR